MTIMSQHPKASEPATQPKSHLPQSLSKPLVSDECWMCAAAATSGPLQWNQRLTFGHYDVWLCGETEAVNLPAKKKTKTNKQKKKTAETEAQFCDSFPLVSTRLDGLPVLCPRITAQQLSGVQSEGKFRMQTDWCTKGLGLKRKKKDSTLGMC